MRSTLSAGWALGMLPTVLIFAMGCGTDQQSGSASSSGETPPGIHATADPHGAGGEMAAEGEDHSPGPELSAEDQQLAMAQKSCPVSEEELGSMGSPVKVMVKGEPIFLCCKACEKKVQEDPDAILAKVAELKKGGAEPEQPKE